MNIYLKNSNISISSYELSRNKRSQTRDSLSQYINNISISNMDSVRTHIGMLSMLTSQTDELSRKSAVI